MIAHGNFGHGQPPAHPDIQQSRRQRHEVWRAMFRLSLQAPGIACSSCCCYFEVFLVDVSVPEKNIYHPPPPKLPNSPQTPSRPLGPSPSWIPPPPGIFNKNRSPPLLAPRTPLPPPRAEKNKKYLKRPPSFAATWPTQKERNASAEQDHVKMCASSKCPRRAKTVGLESFRLTLYYRLA